MVTPSDRALRRLIHRTIEFVVNYGAGFEVRINAAALAKARRPLNGLSFVVGWARTGRAHRARARQAGLCLPGGQSGDETSPRSLPSL